MQLAVLGFAAFILIFNIVISFTRGFRKSLLRLITVVLAVVAAYFAARAVAATAGREIVLWLEATLGGDPNFAPLFNGEVAAGDAVSLLVKLFVAPLLFLLLFVVIKALLIFLYWILCGVTRPKYADTCVSGKLFIECVEFEFTSDEGLAFSHGPDVAYIGEYSSLEYPINRETIFKVEFKLYVADSLYIKFVWIAESSRT